MTVKFTGWRTSPYGGIGAQWVALRTEGPSFFVNVSLPASKVFPYNKKRAKSQGLSKLHEILETEGLTHANV